MAVNVIDKYGRKHFYFKHTSTVLALFIIVVLQVLEEFNRPHLPPPLHPNREEKYMEEGTSNEDPAPSQGKSKINIAWRHPTYFWRSTHGLLFLGDLFWVNPL